jgi:hypothetical protein
VVPIKYANAKNGRYHKGSRPYRKLSQRLGMAFEHPCSGRQAKRNTVTKLDLKEVAIA